MKNLWSTIKQKLDSTSSSMQDGDWTAMESMLNDHPQFKRSVVDKRKLGWFTFSTVLIGLSTYLIYASLQDSSGSHTNPDNPVVSTVDSSSVPTVGVESVTPTHVNSTLDEAKVESIETTHDVLSSIDEDVASKRVAPPRIQLGTEEEAESVSDKTMISATESGGLEELGMESEMVLESKTFSDRQLDAIANTQIDEGTSLLEADSKDPLIIDDSSDMASSEVVENNSEEQVGQDHEEIVEDSSEENSQTQERSEEEAPILVNQHNQKPRWMLDAAYGGQASVNTALVTQEFGLELGYENRGWMVQTGLQLAQTQGKISEPFTETVIRRDTSFETEVQSRLEDRIIKTWIITGYYMGEYVYDTTQVTVYDTVQVLVVDTSSVDITRFKSNTIRTSYLQIPLLVGYQWKHESWGFGLQGGMNMRRVSYVTKEYETTSAYGFDALFRPFVTYAVSDHWHMLTRLSLAVPISIDPLLNTKNFTRVGISAGVRYSW